MRARGTVFNRFATVAHSKVLPGVTLTLDAQRDVGRSMGSGDGVVNDTLQTMTSQ